MHRLINASNGTRFTWRRRDSAAITNTKTSKLGTALLGVVILALLFVGVASPPAFAQPVFVCAPDAQGANDEPGQKDLTRVCAAAGTGVFELFTKWNWDLTTLSGANTADACSLDDSDADGLANLAVCVTIRNHSNPVTLGAVRLFTCNDTKADRCAGPMQVAGNKCVGGDNAGLACTLESDCLGAVSGVCAPDAATKNTTCTMAVLAADPFPAGEDYPSDAVATCSVDLNDFGLSASITLLDACSYPSEEANSDPSDCVIGASIQQCTTNADCVDGNVCTLDTCDTVTGLCVHPPNPDTNQTCGGAPSGLCDAQNTCAGIAAICAEHVQPAGTVCNAAAGVCDVAEVCDGTSPNCPANVFAAAGTACGSPSDTECDNPDTCNGAGACSPNNEAAGFACGTQGVECQNNDACDSSGACTDNGNAANGTACGSSADTECSNPDTCQAGACSPNNEAAGFACGTQGVECQNNDACDSSGACTDNGNAANGTACGSSADTECSNPDTCQAGACSPNNEAAGFACGSGSDTECDNPDTCNSAGGCQVNNEANGTLCGDAGTECTNQDLCQAGSCQDNGFKPTTTTCGDAGTDCINQDYCSGTGTCTDNGFKPTTTTCGDNTNNACTDPDTCDGTGFCQPNNQECGALTDSTLCEFDFGPGTCDPDLGSQFRLLFTPDVQNWVAYKLNASNPGQFYYNLFVEGTANTTVSVTIVVPWPFITHGAMPVHAYDGDAVAVNGCFVPGEALAAYPATIGLANWAAGSGPSGTGFSVVCDDVSGSDLPNNLGFTCEVTFDVPIPASGIAYANIHLDYGLKGKSTDANPDDNFPDRYKPNSGPDALVAASDPLDTVLDGTLALADCTEYEFSHTPGPFSASIQNMNGFASIAGAFGLVSTSETGAGLSGIDVLLFNSSGQLVASGTTNAEGYYLIEYKHKGKPAWYTIVVGYAFKQAVELKANGWAEVSYDAYTGTWTVEVK
jgi:hypothetical protein